MKQFVTQAIVLNRIDYGEADRILTLLTPEYGKITLLARGVRRVKSKLAGGIELFSVSEITFIKGRGDMGTLVSTRLVKHYGSIVSNLDRTMLGYELIKRLHKATEEETEDAYFKLLVEAFEALDDPILSLELIRFWFTTQLLRISGHTPNLHTDESGQKLSAEITYMFSFEHMSFTPAPTNGNFSADHIKFLRLALAGHSPKTLAQIQGSKELADTVSPLVNTMLTTFLRV